MAYLLDTNILIGMRDNDLAVMSRVAELDGEVMLSIVSRVELEGGVYRDAGSVHFRRARLDEIVSALHVLPFSADAAAAYGKIVETAGYSRRKLLDRMIAAQAIVSHATLVTLNPRDFEDIPGLALLGW